MIRRLILVFTYCILGCNSAPSETHPPIVDSSQVIKLATSYKKGKLEFSKFCIGCHFAPDRQITDQPIFDNIFERLPDPPEEYFIKYIRDSKALKESGDKYALNVDDSWNMRYNHEFKDSLSGQEFYDLITYIKVAAKSKFK